jgi:hypothetical protein
MSAATNKTTIAHRATAGTRSAHDRSRRSAAGARAEASLERGGLDMREPYTNVVRS